MKRISGIIVALYFPLAVVADEIRVPGQHPTIQSAIDAATEGDTVTVAPGTYLERITMKSGIRLRSAGSDEKGALGLKRAEATILDGGGGLGGSPGITLAEGATLDGFTVMNVGKYDEKKWRKHWDEKGDNQSHEHIGEFGTPGIAITGVSCTVTNNIVHHVGSTGIAIRGVEGKRCAPIVAANVCYRNMGGGIGSMNGSTAIIDGNTCFENFYAGIGHDNAAPIVIRNVCYGNIRAGIGISEGASPVVRQNRCYQNRRAGIGIRTGSETRPVVEDNDCYENEMAGIGVEDKASPVVRGNRCHRNQLAGIGCRQGSTPVILENRCHENKAAGIGSQSAEPLVLRNQSEKNASAGIGISGKSKALLIGNVCLENGLVAVGVTGESVALLQSNTLVRTGGMPPILAIFPEAKVALLENTIKGGGIAAVMAGGQLTAVGNDIEGQKGHSGIFVRESSKTILLGNRIRGYRKQVRDDGVGTIVHEPGEQAEEKPEE